MKTVLNISTPITLISPWFHATLRPLPSHANEQKTEKGRQCKEDKREKKEKKKTDLPIIFYIVTFWREKDAHLGRDINSKAPFSAVRYKCY